MPNTKRSTKATEHRGEGDELHQPATGKHPPLTTNQGVEIADNQNSLKDAPRGATLLEDFILREKITHFDHERIPERIVHARGSGAHGYFELTRSLSKYTTAAVLSEVGEKVPVFARFSTVAGGAGSVDTPRDVRGFAVKFYTQQGNWDLVGNNIPVFFIQDAIKFPDLIHAVKMEPDRGFPQAASAHDTFWDFISLTPEAMHMVMWAMSDRAIPRSLRMIEGFGIHSFRLISKSGKSTFVKFHFRPKLGLQSLVWDEAVKIAGADSDFHRRDLFEAIESGQFPEWTVAVQLFSEEEAEKFPFDHLDPTKLIPEELVPLTEIGRMVLNRNPDNFFAETEQAAFCPANIVPGMDFTNDPLLQGRLFSYLDTQISRFGGVNFHELPINAPKCPFANNQRDGKMRSRVNKGRVAYEPSSLEPTSPRETASGFRSAVTSRDEGARGRLRPDSFADHYSQARQFFFSQSEIERAHIASALVFELSKVETQHVRDRMVSLLRNVDEGLAKRVADGLGFSKLPAAAPCKVKPVDHPASPALGLIQKAAPSLQGRVVGILCADGSSKATVDKIRAAAKKAGGTTQIVAPRVMNLRWSSKGTFDADGKLEGTPSMNFDAVALVLSTQAAESMKNDAAAVDFVRDAFGHLKAVAYDAGAKALVDASGIDVDDEAVLELGVDEFIEWAKTRNWNREPKLRKLA
ncbi:MAG: catalase [Myxococcales bacterium]|nr:catalase [Myxococcales bacterium]